MEMQRKSYPKDSNVGAVVGVVTPTDSNVGVGGVVRPNGTANHELAAQVLPSQPLLKLRIAALMIKAAHQFMEAKGSWEMNEINTTEEAIPTRYYCHKCRHVVTVHVEMKCPFCQGGFIQACEGVASLYLAMPSESELYESASDREGSDEVNPSASLLRPSGPHANANPATAELQACVDSKPTEHVQITVGNLHGENTVFVQEHSRPRVTPVQWIFLLSGFGLEISSAAVDQVSSTGKLTYAIISLCLAIAGVVTCIWELIHGRMKEKDKDASSNSMVYRSLPDIFGLGLAVIQGVWSALQFYFHLQQTSNPVRLSPVALYFYVCLVVLKYHRRGSPYGI